MKHSKEEVLVYKETTVAGHLFRLEEFWEEDDAGFCCVDYVLEKHTRLAVYGSDGSLLRTFDFDSREYDKDMTLDGDVLTVTYCPFPDECVTVKLDVHSLEEVGSGTASER